MVDDNKTNFLISLMISLMKSLVLPSAFGPYCLQYSNVQHFIKKILYKNLIFVRITYTLPLLISWYLPTISFNLSLMFRFWFGYYRLWWMFYATLSPPIYPPIIIVQPIPFSSCYLLSWWMSAPPQTMLHFFPNIWINSCLSASLLVCMRMNPIWVRFNNLA